jgi:hypothetical protein
MPALEPRLCDSGGPIWIDGQAGAARTGRRMPNQTADASGPDPICEDAVYPRYPPGEYDVRCCRVHVYRDPRFKRWVCRLDCHFLTERAEVVGFLNMGNGESPTAGRGSEYWRVWVLASGEQPRRRRMPKRTFIGRVFRVRIEDTTLRYDQQEHSEAARYSTIKKFISCIGP